MPASGVVLATVEGELDLATAPELDIRVRAELCRRRPRWLVMDLSGLQFLGLHGTAVFERLRRGAGADGVGMILAGLPAAGERALRFAGVLERFPHRADLPTALIIAREECPARHGSRDDVPHGAEPPDGPTAGLRRPLPQPSGERSPKAGHR